MEQSSNMVIGWRVWPEEDWWDVGEKEGWGNKVMNCSNTEQAGERE